MTHDWDHAVQALIALTRNGALEWTATTPPHWLKHATTTVFRTTYMNTWRCCLYSRESRYPGGTGVIVTHASVLELVDVFDIPIAAVTGVAMAALHDLLSAVQNQVWGIDEFLTTLTIDGSLAKHDSRIPITPGGKST